MNKEEFGSLGKLITYLEHLRNEEQLPRIHEEDLSRVIIWLLNNKGGIREAKLYTIKEIMELLDLPYITVYRLIKDGKIHAINADNREKIRVAGKFLLRYLEGDQPSCCDANAVFGEDNHSEECKAGAK